MAQAPDRRQIIRESAIRGPGTPTASWPPAVPGKPFDPPSGRGTQRLISSQDTARCPSCRHAVRLRLDGRIVAHNKEPGHCPGGGEQPAGDSPLACWLPVKNGLTPHGLRHSHKTWMERRGVASDATFRGPA